MKTNAKVLLLAAAPAVIGAIGACDSENEPGAAEICADLQSEFEACGFELDSQACLDAPITAEGLLGSSCEELSGYAGSADTPEGGLFGENDNERFRTFDLRLNAFIPCELIPGPPLTGYFSGDGRGFDWDESASSRLAFNITFGPGKREMDIGVDPEKHEVEVGASHEWSGSTLSDDLDGMGCQEVLSKGNLSQTKTASKAESMSWDVFDYRVNSDGSGSMDLELRFHGKLPLTPAMVTPDISHNLRVTGSWDGRGHYEVNFSGEHDPFPAHEVYLYDGRSWEQAFDRDPAVIQQSWNPNNSPLDLCFGLCDNPERYSRTCTREAGDRSWSCF